ncbi:STAS domain-containing protein [Ureibacillus chungkukjangi]|uniref:Anti-sigma factor antagonist n=1 Tax=Ureibacillus chungkukjangi TaxID=1202712 RepID=A0A318TI40_9BACL|nr:STAS domain-containing protein [Ureibacillus chungkukjangi]MCM3387909.1 STAS domain-containing protein [Ureibacillus chungkukjangi]PYF03470.1 anti-sigma B factor antagonist [Ureibacillus chungkukjangi]
MRLNIQFREIENLLIGYIEGEIDINTAPILKDEFELIVLSDGMKIELDLSKVAYMDSSGLGVIVAFYKKVIREKVDLKLLLSERMMRIFKITGLCEFMDIEKKRSN